ncbi:oxidoreductase [Chromobacterium haemolyticum]|uniref:oxidoreductase n=1 Tax=Chromobacterium haemolyticum TaxID=394935 RepID=UPI0009D9DE62|nr:oxidoreductase [Chromobacterium haemolyticum]OQS42506.1 flagellin modification protein A [Chromobacterium haemolyticum]
MSDIMQERPLSHKVVVVSGGAGLLGRTFSFSIAAAGGIVVVADIKLENAQLVANEICAEYPDRALAIELDITSKESIAKAITLVCEKFGTIDAVVNNAYPRNTNYGRQVEDVTYEDFCQNLGLHAGGYFLVMQQFSAYFSLLGHGNIINISSIYGVISPRFEVYEGTTMTMPVEYAAIKAGVIHLTKYFAQYLKGKNVRVNAISPGGVLNQQPEVFLNKYKMYCSSKGMLEPSDIAGVLLFLLSDSSHYLTGQNIIVDDGFSL